MRLQPVENPKPIVLQIAFWVMKRMFGKVIAPASVIYSRSVPIMMFSNKVKSTEEKLSLPKEYILLIRNFISHLNDCPWCSDFQEYQARKNEIEVKKTMALLKFRESEMFSEKEKSMLAFVEEATLNKSVADQTFEELKNHFNEKEIVEITWVNATENYYTLLAKPLGLTSDNLS